MGNIKEVLPQDAEAYTLCVIYGYGGGYAAVYPNSGSCAITSPADFTTLGEISEMSMERFLSIMNFQYSLQIRDIAVLNMGGFINHAAQILLTDGKPLFSQQSVNMMLMGTDFSLEIRHQAARNRDYHVSDFTDGKKYPVCRIGKSYFDSLFETSIYLSIPRPACSLHRPPRPEGRLGDRLRQVSPAGVWRRFLEKDDRELHLFHPEAQKRGERRHSLFLSHSS